MKKNIFLFLVAVMMSCFAFSQNDTSSSKNDSLTVAKDSLIQLMVPINSFRALINELNSVIDSKSANQMIVNFLTSNARLVLNPQQSVLPNTDPKDKPKEKVNPPAKKN